MYGYIMAANTRVATAVQILCVMAYSDGTTTSDFIAHSLQTNPVVVRRLLKSLEVVGYVSLRPGKDGGVHLDVPPDQITLSQVFQAVEGDGTILALRPGGNPDCPVNSSMGRLLTPVFRDVSEAVSTTLGKITIADLVTGI